MGGAAVSASINCSLLGDVRLTGWTTADAGRSPAPLECSTNRNGSGAQQLESCANAKKAGVADVSESAASGRIVVVGDADFLQRAPGDAAMLRAMAGDKQVE